MPRPVLSSHAGRTRGACSLSALFKPNPHNFIAPFNHRKRLSKDLASSPLFFKILLEDSTTSFAMAACGRPVSQMSEKLTVL